MFSRFVSSRVLLVLGMALTCTGAVQAKANPADDAESTTRSVKARAISHLDSGKPEQAYRLLNEFLDKHRQDGEYRFLVGMSAMETERPGVAADHFEAALEQNPDLPRVRLELARAYEAVGRNSKAKAEFEQVLQMQPPLPVRNNVEQYLSYVDEKKKLAGTRFSGLSL